jgi:WD40 repeat protein
MECPAEDELVNLIGQKLAADRADAVREHSYACSECNALLVEMLRERESRVSGPPLSAASMNELGPSSSDSRTDATGGAAEHDRGGLGRYRLERLLGRGGMGEVYLAADTRLGRHVAVKFLSPKVADDARVRARFAREALITARLQHPSIVGLHDIGSAPTGEPFYVMRLVPGKSLADAIQKTATLRDRLALLPHLLHVADALAFAHRQRIVHRDLKPANVLVGEFGETVVVDWGLAKDLRSGESVAERPLIEEGADLATRAGAVIGTPAYMSPEQAEGKPVDEHADVYAIGAMLYELLAQRPPYRGESGDATVEKVRAGPPAPLDQVAPGAPADLCAIAGKAMTREPTARYRTAAELAEELRRFQTGQLVAVHHYSLGELVKRWIARHRSALSVAALFTVVLVALGSYGLVQIVRSRDQARAAEADATARALSSEEAQGRQALVDGHPLEAAALLVDAMAGDPRPAVRFLLARAEAYNIPLVRKVGQVDPVNAVAVSPDGSRMVVAGEHGLLAILDARTGTVLQRLSGIEGGVWSAQFSPDGQRVVACGQALYGLMFDAASGKALFKFKADSHVRFSGDGNQILTSDNTDVVLLSAATGERLQTLSAPYATEVPNFGQPLIEDMAFSRDGSRIGAAFSDGTAHVWEVSTGRDVLDLNGHARGMLHSVAFSPNGDRILTSGEDGTARTWDATNGKPLVVLEGHGAAVITARFSPDGTLIATGGNDGSARLWDAGSGALLGIALGPSAFMTVVEFSADGTSLLTAGRDGGIRLWDLRGYSAISTFAQPNHVGIEAIAIAPDGVHVMTSSHDVYDWSRPSAGVTTLTTPFKSEAGWTISFAPDGRHVAVSGGDDLRGPDTRTAILPSSGGSSAEVVVGGAVRSNAFDQSGDRMVTIGDHTAMVSDPGSGQRLITVSEASDVWDAVLSPDGSRLAIGMHDGTAEVRDVPSGQLLFTVDHHTPDLAVRGVTFSPDGRRILTVGSDRLGHLWDARSGAPLATLSGHTDFVNAGRYSPDGSLIATGSFDGTARIWDAATGEPLMTLDRHMAPVLDVEFTPDGKHLAVASWDHTVRILDVALETRSPAEVTAAIEGEVPFRLEHGQLLGGP